MPRRYSIFPPGDAMTTDEVIGQVMGELFAEIEQNQAPPVTRDPMTNRVEIHYAYPSSPAARELGDAAAGGYFVQVGSLPVSPLLKTVLAAERFCEKHRLNPVPHRFREFYR
jgi:hypothetical protein